MKVKIKEIDMLIYNCEYWKFVLSAQMRHLICAECGEIVAWGDPATLLKNLVFHVRSPLGCSVRHGIKAGQYIFEGVEGLPEDLQYWHSTC